MAQTMPALGVAWPLDAEQGITVTKVERTRVRFLLAALFAGLLMPAIHPQVPEAPRALEADTSKPGEIELTWNAPRNDGGAPIERYLLFRDGKLYRTLGAGASVAKVTKLAEGERHEFEVQAINKVGRSEFSAKVLATAVARPAAPAAIGGSADPKIGAVNLEWHPPLDDGGSPLTGYEIYRSEQKIGEIGPKERKFNDSTLEANTDGVYRVAAKNIVGVGPKSDPVTIHLPPSGTVVTVISANSQGALTSKPLIAGIPYIVEASGVWQYGIGQADPECSTERGIDDVFRTNRWARIDPRGDVLDVYIQGGPVAWVPLNPIPGSPGCSSNNTYRYRYIPPTTGVVALTIRDTYYRDNRGGIVVQFIPDLAG